MAGVGVRVAGVGGESFTENKSLWSKRLIIMSVFN
jgi:hypothetical protein